MPATLAGMASQKPGKPPVSPAKTPAARNKAAGAAVSVQAKSPTFKKKAVQPVGRPSSYCPEFAEQARKFCLLGATDKRLAELFEVSEATIDNWKRDYPEFLGSLKAGKEIADANVASSLYQRALGYSHAEDDIRALNGEIVITKTIKRMRSINRVPCALGAGVIGTAKVRCRTAAQRLGSSMRQGSNAS